MAAEGEIEGFPYPRDLLRRFSGDEAAAEASPEFAGEVELSLGLSLGGGGGGEKGLARSSSISMFPAAAERAAAETQWLARTHSLPVESEEEWRRRKEMQSMKRMEAKRKRSEKRARERKGEAEEEVMVVGPTVKVKEEEVEEVVCGKAKGVAEVGGAYRWAGPGKPGSQGSIGSQGSSSSGVSDFESKPLHGLETAGVKNCTEVRTSSMLEHAASNAITPSPILKKHASPTKKEDEPPKRRKISTVKSNGAAEMERSLMDEMPCVSTRGDGPNGKRIEGFLYRYRKGEEVRIVCVCHGSFLTPAEFVKHAGGGDVDHPLRHIVVNPNPFAML